MNISIDAFFKQSPDCLLEDMDGEFLLYNPANTTTLHLNQPSMIILSQCDGETSVATIIDQLQAEFPEQGEQIESDVMNLIKDLVEREVLMPVEQQQG